MAEKKADTVSSTVNYYGGIIISVEFFASEVKGNYDCMVVFGMRVEDQISYIGQIYEDIFTHGRCEFQDFIDDFGIMEEDVNGRAFLNTQKLPGMYCVVFVDGDKVSSVVNLRDDTVSPKLVEFFDKHIQTDDSVSNEEIPDMEIPEEILHYWMIPMTEPYNEWKVNQQYHACISDVDCYASDGGDDKNIKVTVYVFNGGTVKRMNKYLNRIYSTGAEEFGQFCQDFDLVEETNGKHLKGVICTVTLSESRRGNFYPRTIQPLENANAAALHQYELLLRDKEEYFSECYSF